MPTLEATGGSKVGADCARSNPPDDLMWESQRLFGFLVLHSPHHLKTQKKQTNKRTPKKRTPKKPQTTHTFLSSPSPWQPSAGLVGAGTLPASSSPGKPSGASSEFSGDLRCDLWIIFIYELQLDLNTDLQTRTHTGLKQHLASFFKMLYAEGGSV